MNEYYYKHIYILMFKHKTFIAKSDVKPHHTYDWAGKKLDFDACKKKKWLVFKKTPCEARWLTFYHQSKKAIRKAYLFAELILSEYQSKFYNRLETLTTVQYPSSISNYPRLIS